MEDEELKILEVQGGPRQQALEDGSDGGTEGPGPPNWGMIHNPQGLTLGDSLGSPPQPPW